MTGGVDVADFHYVADLLKKYTGISIGPDKAYLLESRLLPVARRHGMHDLPALVDGLRKLGPVSGMFIQQAGLLYDVLEAMTINETSFFRDTRPFDQFRKHILPEIIAGEPNPANPIRIWSAASSTGQEAYTLAMCLQEEKMLVAGRPTVIMASDLSRQVVEKAKAAEYSQFEVQRGMPMPLLVKYFTQEGNVWRLAQVIRQMVQFETHNLIQDCKHFGMFDVIYCRNVLIYFEVETKREILERLMKVLKPSGFLILGSSETLIGISDKFESVKDLTATYKVKL